MIVDQRHPLQTSLSLSLLFNTKKLGTVRPYPITALFERCDYLFWGLRSHSFVKSVDHPDAQVPPMPFQLILRAGVHRLTRPLGALLWLRNLLRTAQETLLSDPTPLQIPNKRHGFNHGFKFPPRFHQSGARFLDFAKNRSMSKGSQKGSQRETTHIAGLHSWLRRVPHISSQTNRPAEKKRTLNLTTKVMSADIVEACRILKRG